jgi:hypothetical protein
MTSHCSSASRVLPRRCSAPPTLTIAAAVSMWYSPKVLLRSANALSKLFRAWSYCTIHTTAHHMCVFVYVCLSAMRKPCQGSLVHGCIARVHTVIYHWCLYVYARASPERQSLVKALHSVVVMHVHTAMYHRESVRECVCVCARACALLLNASALSQLDSA